MKRFTLTVFICLFVAAFSNAQTVSTNENSTDSSSTTSKRRPVFRATKEQISTVQIKLKNDGIYSGDSNGRFSADFRKAIKTFQAKNSLKKTGTLNRATLEKMGIVLTEKQKSYPVNPNSYDTSKNSVAGKSKGNSGRSFRPTKKQITEAQTKLKDTGNFDGELSGKYSKEFRASLKEFQEANGLRKTGKLDRTTLEKMGIALTKKQLGIETSGKPRRKSFRVNKKQITQAQTMLKDKGTYKGEVTGKYNKDFRAAIKDFQSSNSLKRKGSLNRVTLEKLGIELTESQSLIPANPNDLAKPKSKSGNRKQKRRIFRATKDQIIQVQSMLKDKGLYDGEETGKLNPATRTAIRTWQERNSVKKTGTLNKITLEAMKIELTDKQKNH